MFENIGNKIKVVAQVIAWLGIGASVIWGIVLMSQSEHLIPTGLLVIIVGALCSWLSCLSLYGMGQMIENTDKLVENSNILVRQNSKRTSNGYTPEKNPQVEVKYEDAFIDIICPNCNSIVSIRKGETTATCSSCNTGLDINYK